MLLIISTVSKQTKHSWIINTVYYDTVKEQVDS